MLWLVMATIGVVLADRVRERCESHADSRAPRANTSSRFAPRSAPGSARLRRALLLEGLAVGLLGGLAGLAIAGGRLRLARGARAGRLCRGSARSRSTRKASPLALLVASLAGLGRRARRPRAWIRRATARRAPRRRPNVERGRGSAANPAIAGRRAGRVGRRRARLRRAWRFARPTRCVPSDPASPAPSECRRCGSRCAPARSRIRCTSRGGSSRSSTRSPRCPASRRRLRELDADGRVQPSWRHDRGRGPAARTSRGVRRFKSVSPGLFDAVGHAAVGRPRLVVGRSLRRPARRAGVREHGARALERARGRARQAAARTRAMRRWREVVGVVADVREDGLREPAPTTVYWPSLNAESATSALRDLRRAQQPRRHRGAESRDPSRPSGPWTRTCRSPGCARCEDIYDNPWRARRSRS